MPRALGRPSSRRATIAFEVSTFAPHLPPAGIHDNAYAVFVQTLPFRFYSLFALGLVVLNVVLARDFGPMRRAEVRARSTGELVRPGGAEGRGR